MPVPVQTQPVDLPASDHARIHKLISYVFEPSVISTPFIFLIVYTRRHLFTLDLQTVYLLLSVLGAVVPVTYTVALYKLKIISSIFYSARRDRLYFYPLLISCSLGVLLLFANSSTSRGLMGAAFAATMVGAGLGVLTLWHKFSYHLAGLGGALSISVALVGYWGFAFLPIMALVAYSRVRLREHTWLEVTVGGVVGMVVAAGAFRWFVARGGWLVELVRG